MRREGGMLQRRDAAKGRGVRRIEGAHDVIRPSPGYPFCTGHRYAPGTGDDAGWWGQGLFNCVAIVWTSTLRRVYLYRQESSCREAPVAPLGKKRNVVLPARLNLSRV